MFKQKEKDCSGIAMQWWCVEVVVVRVVGSGWSDN